MAASPRSSTDLLRPILSSPARSSPSSSPLSRNPVSLRIYKVLGASFDDQSTKEALNTLSELYAPPDARATFFKSKHVSTDSDDDLDDDALDTPSDPRRPDFDILAFLEGPPPGETAAKARKNLRRDVESKLAEGSQKFLRAFGEVDQKLDALQEHISAMRARCDDAQAQLQTTNEACKTLLDRAGSLREERQDVSQKQSIVSLFLERFTLADDEIEALTSGEVPIGMRFFAAMDKAHRIRDDCRVLMSGEERPSQAGVDIMAATSGYLEKAFDKIFRWCNFEFRKMGRDAQLDVSSQMREAVRRLRARAELLTEAFATLSQTRQSALLGAFLDALTRGGPSGLPRPIELHAHDALRYVGDMLAWVHQAIAAERELLEGLFGLTGDGRMVGSVRAPARGEEEEWIAELMDSAVAKLCVPLKSRVLQTVRAQESSITAYRVSNLLQFYTLTMVRTIGEDALLSTTLKEITDVSYKVFYDAIEAQGRALVRISLDLDDPEVAPPTALLDHAQVLREVMAVYASSLLGDESAAESAAGFARILDTAVDPAVQMCTNAAAEKQRLRPLWDKAVFVLNCLTYLLNVLEPHPFTVEKRKALQDIVEDRVKELTDEHYETLLADTDLKDAVATCASYHPPADILSHLPATQPPALARALRRFAQWLSGLDVVHAPRLARLAAQPLHARVHHAALARLGRAYAHVCTEVRRPENRYEAAATLLGGERPFGQVHLLWQIFGLQEEEEVVVEEDVEVEVAEGGDGEELEEEPGSG